MSKVIDVTKTSQHQQSNIAITTFKHV